MNTRTWDWSIKNFLIITSPKAPSTLATMSNQHCRMLQVERFFRQSRMLLLHCCWCGRGLTYCSYLRMTTNSDSSMSLNTVRSSEEWKRNSLYNDWHQPCYVSLILAPSYKCSYLLQVILLLTFQAKCAHVLREGSKGINALNMDGYSIYACTCGWQVKLCDPLSTRAIYLLYMLYI